MEELYNAITVFYDQKYCKASPSTIYRIFVEHITKAINSNTPSKKIKHNRKEYKFKNPVKWWDSDCDNALRLRKAAFEKCEFSKKLDDYID